MGGKKSLVLKISIILFVFLLTALATCPNLLSSASIFKKCCPESVRVGLRVFQNDLYHVCFPSMIFTVVSLFHCDFFGSRERTASK